jgi:hypothetical protein
MLTTLSPSESLTLVMSGAAATTNPTYTVHWREAGGPFNTPTGSLSGATAVTAVSAPSAGQRQVDFLQIYNADSASVTVTVAKVVSGTSTTIFARSLTSGGTLRYSGPDEYSVDEPSTPSGVGAAAGTGVTASESGNGIIQQTTLTLASVGITVTDALAYASQKVYDFPAGRILILGSTASLAWSVTSDRDTTINNSAAMDWAVGTAAASNITLATTMLDLVPKVDQTLDGAVAAFTTAGTGALAVSAQFDGTGTAKDAYLNVSFPTNTDIDADGTLVVTGTIKITWVQLGDY